MFGVYCHCMGGFLVQNLVFDYIEISKCEALYFNVMPLTLEIISSVEYPIRVILWSSTYKFGYYLLGF